MKGDLVDSVKRWNTSSFKMLPLRNILCVSVCRCVCVRVCVCACVCKPTKRAGSSDGFVLMKALLLGQLSREVLPRLERGLLVYVGRRGNVFL